jgi:hypothetical protein
MLAQLNIMLPQLNILLPQLFLTLARHKKSHKGNLEPPLILFASLRALRGS